MWLQSLAEGLLEKAEDGKNGPETFVGFTGATDHVDARLRFQFQTRQPSGPPRTFGWW
jgi:hypothetical protein